MPVSKLRVGLVGCGQIADAHLQEIRKIECAELVAVCDRQRDLARQAAERFGGPATFDDLDRMLEASRLDVLHVTTPPHTHAAIARRAVKAGLHVYVEKPFTVDAAEADGILAAAAEKNRLVCVGHDQLFDPAWEELRRRYRRGEFGDAVHIDSVQGYDLSGPFGRLLAADPLHWVHALPGGLFQNTVSHALYKITDFLPDERPQVWATWFAEGGQPFPSELRVLLRGEAVSANLHFSCRIKPAMRVTRLYGTRASVEVDFDGRLLRCSRPGGLPGPFAKLEAPFRHLKEAARTLGGNLVRFLRSDLHYFAGMNRLFRLFYEAILRGGESPIPPGEIYRVTALLDAIFTRCQEGQSPSPDRGRCAKTCRATPAPVSLVN